MKDYSSIIKSVSNAVKQIEDDKLKEIAFGRLLEDALNPVPVSSSVQTQAGVVDLTKNEGSKDTKKTGKKEKSSGGAPYNLTTVRQEVKDAFRDVHGKQPGVRPYNTLKQKMHQYFWVLEVGRLKDIEAMTHSEIAYVLDTLFREGVTEKQVTNIASQAKAGYVQRRDANGLTAWRILADGTSLVTVGQDATNESTNPVPDQE